MVGLNPVIVVHTVGGAHVDAWLAGLLAAALLVAVGTERAAEAPQRVDVAGGRMLQRGKPRVPPAARTRERGRFRRSSSLRTVAVTVLLTVATLIKIVALPVLCLWLWRLARTPPGRRARTVAPNVALVLALAAVMVLPFSDGWHTWTPLAATGGVESWASPAHLVAHGPRAFVELFAGAGIGRVIEVTVLVAFLLAFAAAFLRLGRREGIGRRARATRPGSPAETWGASLLLLSLAIPYLLPWYGAWFAPFLGVMTDGVLVAIGTLVSILLALTLVPADPFRGTTTPGVMIWVHDVVAPALLVLFAVAIRRVWKPPKTTGGHDRGAHPEAITRRSGTP
jgi:hypothetical protein